MINSSIFGKYNSALGMIFWATGAKFKDCFCLLKKLRLKLVFCGHKSSLFLVHVLLREGSFDEAVGRNAGSQVDFELFDSSVELMFSPFLVVMFLCISFFKIVFHIYFLFLKRPL